MAAEKESAQVKVIKGETASGFSFAIPASNLDNMELIDAIASLNDADPLAMSKVIVLLLGKDQRKKLYDHVRRKDGTVPAEAVSKEMAEIFTLSNTAVKN
jgi:hypothetical protein